MFLDCADCSVADSRRPLSRAHSGKGGAVLAGALESDPRLPFSSVPFIRMRPAIGAHIGYPKKPKPSETMRLNMR